MKIEQIKPEERLLIEDEQVLTDIACVDPISVHGILGLVNLGETFLTCYYRWRPVKNECGLIVREKAVAHVIERPRSSVLPNGSFDRWLSSQSVRQDLLALSAPLN